MRDVISAGYGRNALGWYKKDLDALRLLVTKPSSLTVPQLKDVCRTLRLKVGGTKAELIVRALDDLKLHRPFACADSQPPVEMLLLARFDRISEPKDDPGFYSMLARARKVNGYRASELFGSYLPLKEMRAKVMAVYPSVAALEAAERAQQRTMEKSRACACDCGQTVSCRCQMKKCGSCCAGPCAFHGR
jgi:hypothetical protein